MTVVSPFIADPPGFNQPLISQAVIRLSRQPVCREAALRRRSSRRKHPECLVHDGPDRGGAAPALGTAAQTSVDLRWAARAVRAWVEARAHLSV